MDAFLVRYAFFGINHTHVDTSSYLKSNVFVSCGHLSVPHSMSLLNKCNNQHECQSRLCKHNYIRRCCSKKCTFKDSHIRIVALHVYTKLLEPYLS